MKLRNGKVLERLSQKRADARTLQNQTDSPLLRLPGEIRNTIYEYALGGHHMYLKGTTGPTVKTLNGKQIPRSHLLALSRTCRQTHSESALMLFSLNDFFGLFLVGTQQPVYQRFLPRQLDAMQSIGIRTCCFWHFNSNLFDITVSFPKLQRVMVVSGISHRGVKENPDRVNSEVAKLFGDGIEVTLMDPRSLYRGQGIDGGV